MQLSATRCSQPLVNLSFQPGRERKLASRGGGWAQRAQAVNELERCAGSVKEDVTCWRSSSLTNRIKNVIWDIMRIEKAKEITGSLSKPSARCRATLMVYRLKNARPAASCRRLRARRVTAAMH